MWAYSLTNNYLKVTKYIILLNLYLSASKSTALEIYLKMYKYPKKLLNYSNMSSCNSLPPPLPPNLIYLTYAKCG